MFFLVILNLERWNVQKSKEIQLRTDEPCCSRNNTIATQISAQVKSVATQTIGQGKEVATQTFSNQKNKYTQTYPTLFQNDNSARTTETSNILKSFKQSKFRRKT